MKHARTTLICLGLSSLAACQTQSESDQLGQWQTTTTGSERPANTQARETTTVTPSDPRTTPSAPAIATVDNARTLPTSAITTVAAMLVEERVDPSDPLPQAPPEPVAPPALEPQIRSLTATVARTNECWGTEPYMRIAHNPPAECNQWFEAIAHGGEASGFAIGRYLSTLQQPMQGGPATRLTEILASTEAHSGIAFVLRRLHSSIASANVPDRNAPPNPQVFYGIETNVRLFEQTTGFPVNELPTWQNIYDGDPITKSKPMVARSLRYWERNGAAASSWSALSEQRLRLWLSADDARVVRAAQLINARRASAHLKPAAIEALNRVAASTSSAEARAHARALVNALQDEPRPGF